MTLGVHKAGRRSRCFPTSSPSSNRREESSADRAVRRILRGLPGSREQKTGCRDPQHRLALDLDQREATAVRTGPAGGKKSYAAWAVQKGNKSVTDFLNAFLAKEKASGALKKAAGGASEDHFRQPAE